jgi:hypothetical protein
LSSWSELISRRFEAATSCRAPNSFDGNHALQGAKAPIADSTHNDQVFDAAKRAEPFAVFDDAFSQTLSDSRECFQFVCRGSVDIDSLISSGKGSRLLIVRRSRSCLIRSLVIVAG